MRKLKDKILMHLLGNKALCMQVGKDGGRFFVAGDSNTLAPLAVEALERHPTFRAILVNAVAEYLRRHPHERNAFASKAYENWNESTNK